MKEVHPIADRALTNFFKSCVERGLLQTTGKKDMVPLNVSRNSNQALISFRASRLRRINWLGLDLPKVRFMRRRENVLLGEMTQQEYWIDPTKDWASRSEAFLRLDIAMTLARSADSLSWGSLTVCATESASIL